LTANDAAAGSQDSLTASSRWRTRTPRTPAAERTAAPYSAAAIASVGTAAGFSVWPVEQRTSAAGGPGALHAKAAIADTQAAFVTIANLTGHALTANMELGLLVRGEAFRPA